MSEIGRTGERDDPQGAAAPQPEGEGAGLDPTQAHYLRQRLEGEQNLALGLVAGLAAAAAGAAGWAVITVATGYQIGFMAIGVGFLVGYAVRAGGKGVTMPFGVAGAGLSLVGCAVGNLLALVAMLAGHEGVPFLEAVGQLDVDLAQELMVAGFSPIDLLFYGIALYEGYRLSFRQLDGAQLERMLHGGPAR